MNDQELSDIVSKTIQEETERRMLDFKAWATEYASSIVAFVSTGKLGKGYIYGFTDLTAGYGFSRITFRPYDNDNEFGTKLAERILEPTYLGELTEKIPDVNEGGSTVTGNIANRYYQTNKPNVLINRKTITKKYWYDPKRFKEIAATENNRPPIPEESVVLLYGDIVKEIKEKLVQAGEIK